MLGGASEIFSARAPELHTKGCPILEVANFRRLVASKCSSFTRPVLLFFGLFGLLQATQHWNVASLHVAGGETLQHNAPALCG